ncbi:DALR anticodon-binding domain-containing protein [Frankia sp. Cr2]|uniref:DALR anticodon-binding domain-containing protein n=1 Tax=Frankia sp. Cr2 TaxID=3073932 RepID=UPI002AD2B1AC|nr:DALR anticodon-binding domain-containing protein [Frankia sp. Cr2]
MTPDDLAETLRGIVGQLIADGELDVVIPAAVTVERSRFFDHGDYATPIALRLAGSARRPPREVAEAVAGRLRLERAVAGVDVAGSGFLNIRLAGGAVGEIARTIVRTGGDYGRASAANGRAALATATPATANLASARRAAVADVSATLLAAVRHPQPPDRCDEAMVGASVSLTRGGEPVATPMQVGAFLTIGDLVDAVGADAARYSLLRVPLNRALALDLDLLARQTTDNPVFHVRYAHARICALLRNAGELGLSLDVEGAEVSLLTHPREGDLLLALGELPRIVQTAAERRAPYRVARYLEEVAATWHRFHDVCRVLPQGDEHAGARSGARLLLADATRIVLANGLWLLGVSAPTRM